MESLIEIPYTPEFREVADSIPSYRDQIVVKRLAEYLLVLLAYGLLEVDEGKYTTTERGLLFIERLKDLLNRPCPGSEVPMGQVD